MRRHLRPPLLIVVSVALVGAAAVVFRGAPALTRPRPLPVADGDMEIVWLYPATNTSWERFVAAVRRAREQLQPVFPGLELEDQGASFPRPGAEVPQMTL